MDGYNDEAFVKSDEGGANFSSVGFGIGNVGASPRHVVSNCYPLVHSDLSGQDLEADRVICLGLLKC